MLEMTLIKVKVTIEGHKCQILGQNSDLTYFQHMAFWEIKVTEVEIVRNVFLNILMPNFCILMKYKLVKLMFF